MKIFSKLIKTCISWPCVVTKNKILPSVMSKANRIFNEIRKEIRLNDTFLYSTIVVFLFNSFNPNMQYYYATLNVPSSFNGIAKSLETKKILEKNKENSESKTECNPTENLVTEEPQSKNLVTLYVNDVAILNVDENDLNSILDELKSQYVFDDDCKSEILEEIHIEKADSDIIPLSYEEARNKILFGLPKRIEYEVQENETMFEISEKFGVTEEEIVVLNNLENSELKTAQKLIITVNKKILNVNTTRIFSEKESIPFKTEEVFDENLPLGTRNIKQNGENGEKLVTKKSEYFNGVEQEGKQEIIDSKMLKDSINEIVIVGTKKQVLSPNDEVLKNLSWPVSYTANITSGYGTRGEKMHYGIDISKSGIKDQPIFPVYDGIVEHAGLLGGYGYCVIISHSKDKSLKSLYAHCNSDIKVKKGDVVSKNQCIASVGSTGDSTGPHLHLELIINDKKVNFMDYYKK